MSNDPQFIWQNQQREELQMSLTDFLERARRHRAKARWTVIGIDVSYALVIAFILSKLSSVAGQGTKAGLVLLALGCAYSLYRRHRQLWPLGQPADAAPATGLERYRTELERWRDDSRNIWLLLLLPLVPGFVFVAAPFASRLTQLFQHPRAMLNAIPFLLLLTVWFVLMIRTRSNRLRSIQQELDSLKGLLGGG